MICKICGYENADDFMFCAGCGATLETENETDVSDDSLDEIIDFDDSIDEATAVSSNEGKGGGVIGIAAMLLGLLAPLVSVGGCLFTNLLAPCCCLMWVPCLSHIVSFVLTYGRDPLAALIALVAIVLGVIAMSSAKGSSKTFGILGIVFGIVGLLVAVGMFVLTLVGTLSNLAFSGLSIFSNVLNFTFTDLLVDPYLIEDILEEILYY